MKEYHYKDIVLLPNYSECRTRSDISLFTNHVGKRCYKSPLVLANMKTVINEELAIEMAKRGYFYIMHRFGIDNKAFIEKMKILAESAADYSKFMYSSVSIGVTDESKKDLDSWTFEPEYITIDIAHGHSKSMSEMIDFVLRRFPDIFLIAGNVATGDGAQFLLDAGAHGIKVGIGPGHACTTKLMTGFSRPQFTAVLKVSEVIGRYPRTILIADGGIEYNGDIAKALVAGADLVMAGHLMAGFEESPGEKIFHDDGRVTKTYFGSASEHNKNMKKYVEGRRIDIPFRGCIWDKIREIEDSLRSSCSYAGVFSICELRDNVMWKVQR